MSPHTLPSQKLIATCDQMAGKLGLLTTRSRCAAVPTRADRSRGISIGMDLLLSFATGLKPQPQKFQGLQGVLSASMVVTQAGMTQTCWPRRFDIMCMEDTWYMPGTTNREPFTPFRMTQWFLLLRTNLRGRPSLRRPGRSEDTEPAPR